MNNLGFGMMRLPVLSGPTDFDYPQICQMVDEFLAAGYTYFDTSFVYHEGKSEASVRPWRPTDTVLPLAAVTWPARIFPPLSSSP